MQIDSTSTVGALSYSLDQGSYEITAYKAGYNFQVVSVSIMEGETLPVSLSFSAITALFENDFESESIGGYSHK